MKKIINILIWALFSAVSFLVSLRYLYLAINQSELIYGIIGLIMFIVSGVLMKEAIGWFKKAN